MSDKLPAGISVLPEFADGERPTAAKLNSLGAQLRRAASEIERAIGDVRSQSYPYSIDTTSTLSQAWGRSRSSVTALSGAEERQLDIANLARLVGPSSNLNPRMLGRSSITEAVPVGVHEFSLRYVPEGPLSGSQPSFADGTVFATFVADPTAIGSAGEYSVTAAGKVYCVTLSDGDTVTYFTDPTEYAGGINYQGARFNVIPDPNQTSALGANLGTAGPDGNGQYTITLPTISHQQSNIEGNSITLDDDDLNYQEQLELPRVITDNFTAGQTIPSGFLFLKNETTSEVYEDAVYYYLSTTSLKVGSVDLTDAISAGDRLSIITIGTDITTTLDDLRTKSFHTHDRTFGEPFVSLDAISGFLAQPGASGAWLPSSMASNFAPQYLHRDGYQSGTGENAFLGTLRMFGTNDIEFGAPSRFIGYDGTDLAIAANSSGSDLRLRANVDIIAEDVLRVEESVIAETGIRGDLGTSSNNVKMYYQTGTLDMSVSEDQIALTAFNSQGKTIIGWNLIIEDSAQSFWSDGSGDYNTGDNRTRLVFHTILNEGVNPFLDVLPVTPGDWDSSENYRLIVWYVG